MKKKKSSQRGRKIKKRKIVKDPFESSRGMFVQNPGGFKIDEKEYSFQEGTFYVNRLHWKPGKRIE